MIIITFFSSSINSKKRSQGKINCWSVLIFLLLFFVAAFRGDFTTDYIGYEDIYRYNVNRTLSDILSNWSNNYPETGFLVFQYIIKVIFNDKLFVFIFSSALIVYAYIKEINEYFPKHIIPLLLFVDIGTYYSSFNVTRQIMAAAIVALGLKYLYDNKLLQYILMVLIASTFHSSALVMIPMYFVLRAKWKKNIMWITSISVIAISALLPYILRWITQYAWEWYNVDSLLASGFNIKNLVGPLFLSCYPIASSLMRKNTKDFKENIWINGTYIYLALSILGMQVSLITRFASFFSIFAVLAFSKSIYDIKDRRERLVAVIIASALIILYGFAVRNGSGYDPYYFIWER